MGGLRMRTFEKVALLLREEYPALEVCCDNGRSLKILRWQCKAEITTSDLGVTIEDDQFINKSRDFIRLAKDTKADLVLTPEYSFPFSVIHEIVVNEELWPEPGKLWCLGTQGDDIRNISNRLDNWESQENILAEKSVLSGVQYNKFVSPLIYLFITTTGKLCIIPQFKTGQMADPRNNFEGPNLSEGNKIFVFDDGTEDAYQNAFLSIICADGLHITANTIFQNVKALSILVFHPQLNKEPRHEKLTTLRRELISKSGRVIRIVTLNWADKTAIKGSNKKFTKPWSAYYKKSIKSHNDIRLLVGKNHIKGTSFTNDDHTEIWYSDRAEHCSLMIVSKGYNGESAEVVTTRDDPDTKEYYTFQDTHWVSDSNSCYSNIKQVFLANRITNVFPYPVCEWGQDCDGCKKSDYFFGSFLGHFDEGELSSKYELVNRFLVGPDEESDEKRGKKLDLLMTLNNLIREGKFPTNLDYFKNENFLYEISDEYPNVGTDIYNLTPKRCEFDNPQALVVICEHTLEYKVEELYKRLSDRFGKKYRNQILLYYKVPGEGYTYYSKPSEVKSITKPNFAENVASIKKANF